MSGLLDWIILTSGYDCSDDSGSNVYHARSFQQGGIVLVDSLPTAQLLFFQSHIRSGPTRYGHIGFDSFALLKNFYLYIRFHVYIHIYIQYMLTDV